MPDSKRTLILSDTHMGKPGGVLADALAPLWRGFGRVVFNGDTAELQMPRHRALAEREVWRLRELADRDGIELVLVCGNHDASISETQSLTLMDGRVLVMHGHALHPGIAPWTPAGRPMAVMSRALAAGLEHDRLDCIETRLAHARQVAAEGFHLDPSTQRDGGLRVRDLLVHPWYALRVLHYWQAAPRLATAFMSRYAPQAQVLIVGHSHRQGVWRRGGRTVINTGCFGFPGRPRAVATHGETLSVYEIAMAGLGCALGDAPKFEMTLPSKRGAEGLPRERAA